MGTMITYPKHGATGNAKGYLADAGPSAPAVVVVQEWWGLQGQIKGVCDRLAQAGFTALAPDLYEGMVVPYHDDAAASAAMASLDFQAATEQWVRGAVVFLKKGRKVGITGFCMGGAVTVIGAARIPELSAAVCFYGLPPPQVASGRDVKVPIQCHFASEDDWITPEKADQFEAELSAGGKTYEVHRYKGHHAFMNEQRPQVHDPKAAKIAWDRCISWLRTYLA